MECLDKLETQASLLLALRKIFLAHLISASTFYIPSPKEMSIKLFNLITDRLGEKKTTHHVTRNLITYLINTSLPALERTLSFQPFSFFHTRTTFKIWVLDLPMKVRKPKYLPWLSMAFTSKSCVSSSTLVLGMFQLQESSDFLKLTLCLHASS